MSDVRLTPSAEDDLAARRAHWRRRQRVLFVIAGVLLVANIIRIAWPAVARQVRAARLDAAENARQRRIAAVTRGLPSVDRIEIDVLAPTGSSQNGSPFWPYGYHAAISDKITLTGPAAEELATTWRNCRFERIETLRHTPDYGLRFYSGNKLLFESSLCRRWKSFYIEGAGDQRQWLTLQGPSSKFMQRLRILVSESQSKRASEAQTDHE